MKPIKVKAPGKLMLFGEHAVVYGQPCLVAAIDRYVTVTTGQEAVGDESVFVRVTRELFEGKYGSANTSLKIAGFDSHYGLGSSAAVTVAVAEALFRLKKIQVTKKELFDFCYQVVKKVQGVGSGFDLAAAIWRGVVYFVSGGKKIKRLPIVELPLVVGYSGVKADTVALVKQVAKLKPEKLFKQSSKIVDRARTVLEKKQWALAGELMNQNQQLLKQMGVSTPKLEKLIAASLKAGAWGAKLSGAGGGDCMIALASSERQQAVEKAIVAAGGEVLKVKLAL